MRDNFFINEISDTQFYRKFGRTKFDTYTVLSRDEVLISLITQYFFKCCFLLDAAREKYSYVSYPTLHFICRIVEFNRNYMKCTKFVRDLSVQGVRIRNSLICYAIQQKMHETHKIWHPSDQNYFFVHFN